MATELEVRSLWRAAVRLLEANRLHADDDTPNVAGLIDDVTAALVSDSSGAVEGALAVLRSRYSAVIGTNRSLLLPILRSYGRVLNKTVTGANALIDEIFKRFVDYESAVIGPDASGTGFVFAATTITRNDSGDWTDVFIVGDYVVIASAEDGANDGTYGPVTAVTSSILTVATAAWTVNADDQAATFQRSPWLLESRGMSLGTPSAAAGNTGTGTLYRLGVDAYGYTAENGSADAKAATVVRSASSGAELHHEVLLLEGETASPDNLKLDALGSGLRDELTALSHRSAQTLQNAGFEAVTTATAPSAGSPQPLTAAPTGWSLVSGTIGDIYATVDVYARQLVGVTTPIALEFRANASIKQLLSTNRVQLSPQFPYLCGHWMRVNSALSAGTATLALGSKSIAKDLTTLTDDTWTFVPIALGSGSWFRNFDQTDLAVTLTLASLAGAGARYYADEVILAPGQFFDGSWYWAIGGTTAWLRGDSLTWTDTETSPAAGAMQRHLARGFGRYLPHSTTPTVPDPS